MSDTKPVPHEAKPIVRNVLCGIVLVMAVLGRIFDPADASWYEAIFIAGVICWLGLYYTQKKLREMDRPENGDGVTVAEFWGGSDE